MTHKTLHHLILLHLTRRDWRLVHPDDDPTAWADFVAAVQRILAEAGNRRLSEAERLDRAVVAAYCPVLYAACCDHDSDRQERAFAELWTWVYRRVYWRIGEAEDAKDVTQQVVLKVYQKLDKVREPRGFLGFVNVITFRELAEYFRRREQRQQVEHGPPHKPDDGGKDQDDQEDMTADDPLLAVELAAAEAELAALLRTCLTSTRGGRFWAEVLIRRVLLQQSVSEVATDLNIPPGRVSLELNRAKQELWKRCAEVIDRLMEHLAPSQRVTYREEDL